MSEPETGTTTPAADAGQANSKTDAKPRPPHRPAHTTTSKAGPVTVTVTEPADDDAGCDECAGEPGKAAVGLGLLICAVAGGLLYIGLDLASGGWFSRKFAGAQESEAE